MAHEWNRGALTSSSWHGLEMVRPMPDADAMLAAGYDTDGWIRSVALLPVQTPDGLTVPGRAVVGSYQSGKRLAFDVVSDAYRPLEPAQWEDLVRAACRAGAQPTGAFSLRGGAVQVACFALPDQEGQRIRTYMSLLNTYDRSGELQALTSSVCVVCANTMAMARSEAAGGIARVRHTGDMGAKVADLCSAVEAGVSAGRSMRELYDEARETRITREQAQALVDRIYPVPAPVDADGAALDPVDVSSGRVKAANASAITRATNRQADLGLAMAREENAAGPTVASIWNGATFLVDRQADGSPRASATPMLDAMFCGSRGKEVERIRRIMVTVLRPDGSEDTVPADSPDARAAYAAQGAGLLDAMLADL